MGFAKPARKESGEREYFQLKNYEGVLCTFRVNDEDEEYLNPNFVEDDPVPTVWADVTILEDDDAGKVYRNAEIRAKYVHESLAPHAGSRALVLGRIEKGRRAYFINEATEAEEKFAKRFFEAAESAKDEAEEELPY